MTITQRGTYGATIHTRNDGEGFDVYFLFNIGTELDSISKGDVWDRKTFKTQKMADRKIEAYFQKQGV